MTCIAATSDEDEDPMLDDEPALKDLRVVLQCCDDLISHEWLLGSLVQKCKASIIDAHCILILDKNRGRSCCSRVQTPDAGRGRRMCP